ncbi:MAG: hypothetical protein IPJ88_11965 [Myxococcales bacterium]|nr:MAG: hypothetical protein IPJ88_11965 [Myxococcales bacterium]
MPHQTHLKPSHRTLFYLAISLATLNACAEVRCPSTKQKQDGQCIDPQAQDQSDPSTLHVEWAQVVPDETQHLAVGSSDQFFLITHTADTETLSSYDGNGSSLWDVDFEADSERLEMGGDRLFLGMLSPSAKAPSYNASPVFEDITDGATHMSILAIDPSDGSMLSAKDFVFAGNQIEGPLFDIASDSVFVAGTMNDNINVVVGESLVQPPNNMFITKLDTQNMDVQWITGLSFSMPNTLIPGMPPLGTLEAKADHVILCGNFGGTDNATDNFGDGVTRETIGGTDIFIMAFNASNGALRWVQTFGGPGNDGCNTLSIGEQTVWVGGHEAQRPMIASLSLEDGSLNSHKTWDVIAGEIASIEIDAFGDLYIGGSSEGSWKPYTLPGNSQNRDIFILRYRPSAKQITWSKLWSAQDNEMLFDMILTEAGALYSLVEFNGPFDFGTGSLGSGNAAQKAFVKVAP